MKKTFPFILFFTLSTIYSQEITIEFKLETFSKRPHKNVTITAENTVNHKKFVGVSDQSGVGVVKFPEGGNYEIKLSNSPDIRNIPMPNKPGMKIKVVYKYKGGEEDWSKKYPLSESLKREWDLKFKKYPKINKTKLKSRALKYDNRLVSFKLTISNIEKKPLIGEKVFITAKKYQKTFTGITDKKGNVFMLLPKGDKYDVNFKLDKNYKIIDMPFTSGKSKKSLGITYLGTKEILRRKKEKELRIKKEEERLAKERAEFEKYLKESKKRAIEAKKERLLAMAKRKKEKNIIAKVFDRNKWRKKLVVCDLTGSMAPYAAQLASWYTLNYMVNKDVQFVFFNDGDGKSNSQKVIGETGGIYYSPNIKFDDLINLMARVQAAGHGGDCPENNMEALIKGTKQAKSFKDIIMIVDNNAPVKDMELLKKFNRPVHIILCGAFHEVEEDYLEIAYKTRGSIHTIEKDLKYLWKMAEGRKIKFNGFEYILMKGKFIKVNKS